MLIQKRRTCLLSTLNRAQREAVTTTEGPVLVLAGAGTGKTRVITSRIAHLIQKGVDPRKILAVTFTNKAAREMQERVTAITGTRKTRKKPHISTFHKLGLTILQKETAHTNRTNPFTICDQADAVGILREILHEIVLPEGTPDPELYQQMISAHKSRFIRQDADDSLFSTVFSRYETMLAARNAYDLDDLIGKPIQLLGQESIRKKYHKRFQYILVDEYQDTNQIQYDLLQLLVGPKKNLCVVGDDDQSIYRFRGAQREKILRFRRDYPKARAVKLEENYRSTNRILNAANSIIQRSAKRHKKKLFSRLGDGEKIRFFEFEDNYAEADAIVDEIKDHALFRKRDPNSTAILLRSIFQARVFEEKLRLRDVPYTLVGGRSWYDRKEIKDALAYLKLLVNEKDEGAFRRIVNFPRRGVGPKNLEALIATSKQKKVNLSLIIEHAEEIEGLTGQAARSLAMFSSHLNAAQQTLRHGKTSSAAWQLLESVKIRNAIKDSYKDAETGEMRARSIDALLASLSHHLKENPGEGIADYISRFALESQLDKEKEKTGNGATLITVHSAKGLEFDNVYIPGFEEGILPHEKSIEEGDEAIEEERRLVYVGMTRAKKHLTLSFCTSRRKYQEDKAMQRSRFFSEIPEELLTEEDPHQYDRPLSQEEGRQYLSKLLQERREKQQAQETQ